ncbi:MAG: hypothetical protein A2909_00370, partial [Candidatus Tagabacteria bacterium RIFCSPLOWO2_01_FULL_39_11]
MGSPIYKRVILKISGEALKLKQSFINIEDAELSISKQSFVSAKAAEFIAEEIKPVLGLGVQIGIVVGGGNVVRGCELEKQGFSRDVADNMGMTATIINAQALQDVLERKYGIVTRVQSAVEIKRFVEPYIPRRALRHFEKNRVVILAGGTGNDYCTTDNAAVTRAYELRADAVLKGTKVNGLYDKDPVYYKTAKLIPKISYQEFLKAGFSGIIDNQAIGIIIDAKEKIPIHIFNIFTKGNFYR